MLGFTADRRQIDAALGGLGLFDLTASAADPLRLVLQEMLGVDNSALGAAPRVARDPLAEVVDPTVLSRLELITHPVEQADRVALKARVELFTRSYAELARQISAVEGRKYMVFLSEGFDVGLLRGRPTATAEIWQASSAKEQVNSSTQAFKATRSSCSPVRSPAAARCASANFEVHGVPLRGFDVGLLQGTSDSDRQEEMRENMLNGESWRDSSEEALRAGPRCRTPSSGCSRSSRRADCSIQAVWTSAACAPGPTSARRGSAGATACW